MSEQEINHALEEISRVCNELVQGGASVAEINLALELAKRAIAEGYLEAMKEYEKRGKN